MKWFIIVAFLTCSFESHACKCGEIGLNERAEESHKTYLGEIISTKTLSDAPLKPRQLAVLKTSIKIKGNIHQFEEVFTDPGSSCSAFFEIGESYLVFEDEFGNVDTCTMWRNSFETPEWSGFKLPPEF